MKSPTSSILYSIQALKTKMRNDHIELQGIRRDFAMGPVKPILELDEKCDSPSKNQTNLSIQKGAKQKIIQIRKGHQQEIKMLKQRHVSQKNHLNLLHNQKIEEIMKKFQQKINEQQSYIDLLEQQLQSKENNQNQKCLKIQNNVFHLRIPQLNYQNQIFSNIFQKNQQQTKKNDQKYDQLINSLLKQNSKLLQQVEKLRLQNRFLGSCLPKNNKQSISYMPINYLSESQSQNCSFTNRNSSFGNNKNRLKFSKAQKNMTNRSCLSINNQNIDTSNIMIRHATSIERDQKNFNDISLQQNSIPEDDESILEEDVKLRTIRHFLKSNNNQKLQIEQFQADNTDRRKGGGLKNAFRRLSVL